MRLIPSTVVVTLAAAGALTLAASSLDRAAAPMVRTVYVTVTDGKGAPVTDLTAADFTVKEGGRDRVIDKAEPATARMRLSLLLEERLVGDGSIRKGLFELMKAVQGSADIGLLTVGLRNTTIVDYTASLNELVGALNSFTLNPGPTSNLTEGILELARSLKPRQPERSAIVVLAISGVQAGGPSAKPVLTELRQSGAVMHAVTLAGGGVGLGQVERLGEESDREQVLGDGPKQTGGRRHDVPATSAVPRAMEQVAGDLLAQYAITYTLPDGVKPDRRFNVSVKRRGVSVRAPSGLPDR